MKGAKYKNLSIIIGDDGSIGLMNTSESNLTIKEDGLGNIIVTLEDGEVITIEPPQKPMLELKVEALGEWSVPQKRALKTTKPKKQRKNNRKTHRL
jgi:hypothetical protein